MSDLTNALDIIFNWLQQNQWSRFKETANSAYELKPGLTRAEIDAIIGDSNKKLPQEVYELYQWRNGDKIGEWDYVGLFDIYHNVSGFGPWGFEPLQSLVTANIQAQNSLRRLEPEIFNRLAAVPSLSGFQILPVLRLFGCSYGSCLDGYVCFDDSYKSHPVVFIDFKGGGDTVLSLYASLTNMMMTLAESYETAYYIHEDGYLTKDTDKVLEIWRKYNSNELVEGVLNKVLQLEPILPQLEMGFQLLKEIADILTFSHDIRLIEPLIRVLRRPPTNTSDDENLDYFRSMSSMYLGWLGGQNAVEPLIQALKDEYWLTRYWSAITLGEIKDIQAVPGLNELLQDNNEMVRKAVQESLYKITNPNSETNPLYSNPAIENLSAAAALYGMTSEDMLNPNIDTLRDKLNNATTNKDNNLNFNDDNPDNIRF